MREIKILTIVGARPQFIKAGPFSKALRKRHKEIILHTGQHYDPNMSEVFFKELGLPKPDINLEVGSGSHAEQTSKMMLGIERVLNETKVDMVLVYGDTNSTVAGSLAASKLHIPVGHIEAGLRSYNRQMPEEINRIVTDHISDILFAPTVTSVKILKKEGLGSRTVFVGDVMYDAIKEHSKLADKSSILKRLGLVPGQYLLSTIHRAENTDSRERLESILKAFHKSREKIVLPLHPRTRKFIDQYQLEKYLDNISVIEPVGYVEMLALQKNARMILTDSGGVQKEGFLLGVPVVTLRDETEWVETVKDGWNKLVGADENKILKAMRSFRPRSKRGNHYGSGNASVKIISAIERWFAKNVRS